MFSRGKGPSLSCAMNSKRTASVSFIFVSYNKALMGLRQKSVLTSRHSVTVQLLNASAFSAIPPAEVQARGFQQKR